MVGNRSVVKCFSLEILVGFTLIYAIGISLAYTNPSDVSAINSLYVSLGSPSLPGWVASGGDPCGASIPWQGVTCDDSSSISSITLTGANLGGELGDSLGGFSSLKSITLSNNLIGGSIPSELPPTLVTIFLSDNRLIGSIPSSLSSLSGLSAMSLNNNQLSGEIPDAFANLPVLVNLDLSSNNLEGELPPSMRNLTSLTTLHLQMNHLTGTLDVLQDLPLRDLNVENNSFSGPIPPKLLSIPTFRGDGNPFNSSTAPLPPPSTSGAPLPATPFFPGPGSEQKPPPTPGRRPSKQADAPSTGADSNSGSRKKSPSTKRIVWISIAAVLSFIIVLLAILLFMPRCLRERETYRTRKRHEIAPYSGTRENHRDGGSLVLPSKDVEKDPPVALKRKEEIPHRAVPLRTKDENPQRPVPLRTKEEIPQRPVPLRTKEEIPQRAVSSIPKSRIEEEVHKKPVSVGGAPTRNPYDIDLSRFDIDMMMPPPPPPPLPSSPPLPSPPSPPPSEKVIVNPTIAPEPTEIRPSSRLFPTTSVRAYSIAVLQQYTNSFSQENLVGSGTLGNVYRAELPDGKLLAVKKLDKRVSNQLKDEQFIELVNSLDRIRHANVVELMGYCAEHGQRLLIYEYCANGTLEDALHSDDECKSSLTWNIRIRMALGAARALEYLHEVCEPPIIHRNFKSANLLLDDELSVLVSDCGLAPLILSGAVSQLSGQLLTTYGYGAPEFESGVYTTKSDVYSFGVVMLELLTGRMSYDRSRARGEQFLVRWAIPQLHDIDALSSMVDPACGGRYPVKSLSNFADIISRCVLAEPEFRPPMSEVVHDLLQMIRRESPNRSEEDFT